MTAFPRPPPGAPAARPAGRSARGLLGIGRELPGGGGARAAGRGSARARGVGVGWGGRAAAARAGGLPGAAWPAPARGPAWRLTARGRAPGSRGRVTEAAAGRGSRGAEEEVPPPARQDVTNRKRVLAGAARGRAVGRGRKWAKEKAARAPSREPGELAKSSAARHRRSAATAGPRDTSGPTFVHLVTGFLHTPHNFKKQLLQFIPYNV